MSLTFPEQCQQFQALYGAFKISKGALSAVEFQSLVQLIELLAKHLGLKYIEEVENVPMMTDLVPSDVSMGYRVIPLESSPTRLMLLTDNPLHAFHQDLFQAYLGEGMVIHWTITHPDTLSQFLPKTAVQSETSVKLPYSIEDFLNTLLQKAFHAKATDIHFEHTQHQFAVRFRVNGVLRAPEIHPIQLAHPTLSRIKLLSNLNISDNQKPQDGHLTLFLDAQPLQLRISVLPLQNGESIVLRIINQQTTHLALNAIGIDDNSLKTLTKLIQQTGIFIVTGPTGSGKTTTLYALLQTLNQAHVNILTAEDPVECEIDGITQVPVNPAIDLSFHSLIRAFLRQDPDILMIGEIRDAETAKMAIQAALTGHRAFSTLHTHNAASTVTRLIDMGITPFLISATLKAIIAQRLIRTLCPHCKKPTTIPDSHKHLFEDTPVNSTTTQHVPTQIFTPGQCPHCHQTGFLGRKAIFELMPVDHDMQNAILSQTSSASLQDLAISKGMSPLSHQAKNLLIAGETSLGEIQPYLVEQGDGLFLRGAFL